MKKHNKLTKPCATSTNDNYNTLHAKTNYKYKTHLDVA